MRIIGGELKGREILMPRGAETTRPITSLAKKSLFDTISGWMPGGTILDLFCGTGTLGIEALSRGAARCYFAEQDPDALRLLHENIKALGLAGRSAVWSGDIEARLDGWLVAVTGPIDVAFVDPPYATSAGWAWDQAAKSIFDPLAARLGPEGLVILRLGGGKKPPESVGSLAVVRVKQYGDMVVAILAAKEHAASKEDAAPKEHKEGP